MRHSCKGCFQTHIQFQENVHYFNEDSYENMFGVLIATRCVPNDNFHFINHIVVQSEISALNSICDGNTV